MIYLVRHAEKIDDSRDAALSEAGLRRADALAEALANAAITAVYATQFQRTQRTAAPLAGRAGVATILEAAGGDAAAHARAVAEAIRTRHAGARILVVGHSNTVPRIVRALGGAAPEKLGDNEYDSLFIVTIPGRAGGAVTTVRARYGEPNAVPGVQPNRM
ncbi:MAG TPA: histidine phosphatase family protein [Gemmatimonadaceae bacterium]|nr:histidine phosphatase family protein [Gemmatimonadaceae bacterium]